MKKDNLILYVYFIIVIVVLLYGCTTQETVKTTTVYLQEMELTGPITMITAMT